MPTAAADEGSSVAWGGTEWLATWIYQHKLYARRFDAASAPKGDLIEHAIPVQGYKVALAGTGSGYGALWTTGHSVASDGDIYFAALDGQGAMVGSPVKVTSSAFNEDAPRIVWNGSGFGVAWRDKRGAEPQIGFRELDATGQPKGDEKFFASGLDDVVSSSLAWTGSGYASGWSKDGGYNVVLLDAAGNVAKGPKRVPSVKGHANTLSGPAMAWHDGRLGIAYPWLDKRYPTERRELFFVELDENLEASSDLVSVPQSADGQAGGQPTLISTKDGFMIAWSGLPAYEIFATTIVCR
jgi:outer membrane protein assembly factor BamB